MSVTESSGDGRGLFERAMWGGSEEREDGDHESREPCAAARFDSRTSAKLRDVAHNLAEKTHPKDGQHDEQDANQCRVTFSYRVSPLGQDHVRQQQKIEHERDAVQPLAKWSLQGTGVSCHVSEVLGIVAVIDT
jgi:hypothetical protein